MATHQSKAQKETISRVMHEFKHGELESSSGQKVKNPKQAIAIGLNEAGASKYESKEKNRENVKRTKARERRGATEKDRRERQDHGQMTREELYAEARRRKIPERSKMSKRELERALH
jgi:CRISPR/Cas system-associated protein Cas5 (RAMP superfamily)